MRRLDGLLGDAPWPRDLLLEALHRIQDAAGHVTSADIAALADRMGMSQAEVFEVATFYAHFDVLAEGQAPPAPVTLRVCTSLSCALAGSEALLATIKGSVDGSRVRVLKAPCMGRCDAAPAVAVGHCGHGHATAQTVRAAIAAAPARPSPPPSVEAFAAYRSNGGYATLEAHRHCGDAPALIARVAAAGIRGLGGAGFPAARKWEAVRAGAAPRYLAVNADEGEPGTFKDRHLLETCPHLVLEGMLLSAWAVGAKRCYIYLRDEYPALHAVLQRECAALEAAGLVAPGVVRLRRGAGAYICGEESAMIESLEGKRGIPRHRPPYVAEAGLFGRPTLVHNVETLYWVARVAREGPEILTQTTRNGCRGRRLFSVSGRVARPGVYDLPAGSTAREVIAAAGGMAEGHRLKAYQPGGASSGLLPARLADLPLDFGVLEAHGSFAGSGALVALSEADSAREAALGMLHFFADESCGQCTPCRVGCAKAVALMDAPRWDRALLEDLCTVMEDGSICGLGQAAANPIRHVIAHFGGEV